MKDRVLKVRKHEQRRNGRKERERKRERYREKRLRKGKLRVRECGREKRKLSQTYRQRDRPTLKLTETNIRNQK